jgi:hypothetical protein
VYQQGVIGASGLVKETVNGIWQPDMALGGGSYRRANFVRRPGGFGIEVLDSAWKYQVFTYRDTAGKIIGASPIALMSNINGLAYNYNGRQVSNIILTIDDPDSNFSDYKMTFMPAQADLKSDGKYVIRKLSDSADCHIGALKMTSGRIQLVLSDTAVTVMHDCVLGALDPTCLTCYWKKYNFVNSRRWSKGNFVIVETSSQRLTIAYGDSSVTVVSRAGFQTAGFSIRLKVPHTSVQMPVSSARLKRTAAIRIYDLHGRLLATAPVADTRYITVPAMPRGGMVIVSLVLGDGSVISQKVPLVR